MAAVSAASAVLSAVNASARMVLTISRETGFRLPYKKVLDMLDKK